MDNNIEKSRVRLEDLIPTKSLNFVDLELLVNLRKNNPDLYRMLEKEAKENTYDENWLADHGKKLGMSYEKISDNDIDRIIYGLYMKHLSAK